MESQREYLDSTFTNVLNRFLAVEVFTEVFDVAQHFLTNDDDWDSLESTAGSILHNAITSMSKTQKIRKIFPISKERSSLSESDLGGPSY